MNKAQTADNDHHQKLDRQQEVEGLVIERSREQSHQRAAQSGDGAGDAKGNGLGLRDIHTHRLRRDLAVAHGGKGTPQGRTQQVAIEQRDHQNHGQCQVVPFDRVIPAADLIAEKVDRWGHLAVHPVGPFLEQHDDIVRQNGQRQRRNRKVNTVQFQRGNGDQRTDDAGDDSCQQKGGQKGYIRFHHQHTGIAAQRHESRMAKANLSGLSGQQHQPQSGSGPDQHVRRLTQKERINQQGQAERQHQKGRIKAEVPPVGKQPDVLIVICLEMEFHWFRPSSLGPARTGRGGGTAGPRSAAHRGRSGSSPAAGSARRKARSHPRSDLPAAHPASCRNRR